MGMYDESWCASCGKGMHYTNDEDAMCGDCASEFANAKMEKLLEFIQMKHDEHESELSRIWNSDVDMFNNDQSSMMDYHEGAVEALGIVLAKGKELFNEG